ncbi:hypothetical protein K9M79_04430 [Candidatus Woesearchaeota archaeon]|nr:hypothetical protein [Candidatus Woesearchaeota archaeon]
MKCLLTLDNSPDIYHILSPDFKHKIYERSKTIVGKNRIQIDADDFVAMRATVTGIMRLIAVYDKLKNDRQKNTRKDSSASTI